MRDRLSKVERLKSIEMYIKTLENNLTGVDSEYFKEGTVVISIETTDFQYNKGYDEEIGFTKDIMIGYMKTQLEEYKNESKRILQELIED